MQVINDASYPAFGVWQGKCYPNSAGRQLAAESQESAVYGELCAAARASLDSRRMATVTVVGRELRVLPVVALDSREDAVMIGQFSLEEIPSIYSEIAGNTSSVDVHETSKARALAEESARQIRFLSELGSELHRTFDPVEIALAACRHATNWIATEAELTFRLFDENVTVCDPENANDAAESAECAVLPLTARNRELGELRLSFTHEQTLSAGDHALLTEFAERIALALDNARMYANERRISTAMQDRLLPGELHQPYGMHVDGVYLPCDDDLRIGGDWYDAFELHDGRLAITVGDVAGHGATAAAMMGTLRQTIRTALLGGSTPSEALALANDVVCGGDPDMATAFVGIVDVVEMTMVVATAGHPTPFVVSDDEIRSVQAMGPPLGAREQLDVADALTVLPDRGALVLFTDGLIEYQRDTIEGLDEFRRVLAHWRDDGMAGDARYLSSIVLSDNARNDDVAMLVVRFAPVKELDLAVESVPSQSEVARRALQRFAFGCGLGREQAADLVLASCEAVNNAIEHAYDGKSGLVRVRGWHDDDRVSVIVEDAGSWSDKPSDEDRGRGLLIIRALSTEMDVQREAGGTSVRMGFAFIPQARRPVAV